jgi:mannose-6-phosphate isomerase-like protein (cupin superfamily)
MNACWLPSEDEMKYRFPSAEEYSAEKARHAALTVVDIRSYQAAISEQYRNDVLSNINNDCMRLAVFEGEYRWHHHPDSDELFLVVAGKLQIEFADHDTVELTEWQYVVVPAGTVHRTRAIGRTVNITYEKQGAKTVFVDTAA